MHRGPHLPSLMFALSLLPAGAPAATTLSLAPLFADHMVLQRDQPLRLWGRGEPLAWAEVELAGRRGRAQIAADGRWALSLEALPAGGPHELTLRSGLQALHLADVMIGDVWLCAGQSNMAWPLDQASDAAAALAAADAPMIRELRVPLRASPRPEEDIAAAPWVRSSPTAAGQFSAVGYHFARRMQAELGVAIGLINTAWNGSHLETWTSRRAALADDDLAAAVRATPASARALARARQQRVSEATAAAALAGVPVPWTSEANDAPSLAHNGMIHPLRQLGLRGILWYQGESNVVRAAAYPGAFQRLIVDWRRQFEQGELPFLFVQLAAFGPLARNSLERSAWAELRDAQRQALVLPHTGMTVATDIGDADDLHPRDKRSVGERLAGLALHQMDTRRPDASGPRLQRVERRGTMLVARFDRDGLAMRPAGSVLQGFALAGADQRFRAAQARISGREVLAWHDDIAEPVALRYGWVDNPSQSNLVDALGLPASPWRSDDWPLSTAGRRHAP